MSTLLFINAVLFIVWILVFSYFASNLLKIGKEINKHMATAAQALQDLQQVVTDLTTAVQGATTELTQLLADIQQANGVNPQQVEASVAQARALITNLNAAVAAASQAANPPAPAPVAVSVSPATTTLAPGGTTTFTASVTGGASGGDQTVKWSAQNGTIDPASGAYTAPAADGTDVVTATSNQDSTKTGTAAVTIAG